MPGPRALRFVPRANVSPAPATRVGRPQPGAPLLGARRTPLARQSRLRARPESSDGAVDLAREVVEHEEEQAQVKLLDAADERPDHRLREKPSSGRKRMRPVVPARSKPSASMGSGDGTSSPSDASSSASACLPSARSFSTRVSRSHDKLFCVYGLVCHRPAMLVENDRRPIEVNARRVDARPKMGAHPQR